MMKELIMYKTMILTVVAIAVLIVTVTGCGTDPALTTLEPASVTNTTEPVEPASGLVATATRAAEDAGDSEPVDSGVLATVLRDGYPDALAERNQLALGSLRLEGTANAISQEQATELKLYWQALLALTDESTTAAEETAAVQTQILESMTAAQIEAIAAMALTNADLNAFYVDQGVVLTSPEPGVTPQGGKNSELSQESREATRTAAEALGTPVGTGGGTGSERRDMLLDTLIALLDQRAGE